jgi:hypothetical protein
MSMSVTSAASPVSLAGAYAVLEDVYAKANRRAA